MTIHQASMEKLSWQQARESVAAIKPDLAKIIDALNPGPEYTLYHAKYPYGAEILKRGNLYVPNDQGKLTNIADPTMDRSIAADLNYNLGSNPVSLVLTHSLECCFPMEDRIIPLTGLINAGDIFGTQRVLATRFSHQPKFIWDMTAGARSVFTLPKISDAINHNRLCKKFLINADKPKALVDQWDIFAQLANSQSFPLSWNAEIIFFSKKWFGHLTDAAWANFNYYLLSMIWKSGDFQRNYFIFDLMFSIIQKTKNMKPSAYVADTVKYLFYIGLGELPGFAPAIDNRAGPIEQLQEIYREIYQIKHYTPTIMQPTLFNINSSDSRPVYYSLQFPNALEFSPKSRKRNSIITELHETKALLTKYFHEIRSGQFNIEDTPLYDLTHEAEFDFFHPDANYYQDISQCQEIADSDPSFSFGSSELNNDFAYNSSFVKGCIRIQKKN